MKFKIAAAIILILLFLVILVKYFISGSSRLFCRAVYTAAKFHSSTSIGGRVIVFVQKSKTAAAAILNFIFVLYFGIPACRNSNVIHVPNFVQICAIINELWTINKIKNGGRRYLEFIIFVHFSQMIYFRWQPST